MLWNYLDCIFLGEILPEIPGSVENVVKTIPELKSKTITTRLLIQIRLFPLVIP